MGQCMNCLAILVFAVKLSPNCFIHPRNCATIMLPIRIILFMVLFRSARQDAPFFQCFYCAIFYCAILFSFWHFVVWLRVPLSVVYMSVYIIRKLRQYNCASIYIIM